MKDIIRQKKLLVIGALLVIAIIIAAALLLSSKQNPYGEEAAAMITEERLPDVSNVMRQAGLSNIDLFETWVYEYHESKNEDYKSTAYSDADDKMTAMLLADDQVKCKSPAAYKGDSLKADIHAMKSNKAFMFISDNIKVFTTLFGEMKIPKSGMKDALPANWKKHHIEFLCDRAYIVSMVVKKDGKDEAFAGHAGILIDLSDMDTDIEKKYLFVEKRASGEAFFATELDKEKDLIGLLAGRKEYRSENSGEKPLVYINNKYLGEVRYSDE